MTDGYPAIQPYDHGTLDAGDDILVYWEACGEPVDVAVLCNALEDNNPTRAELGALVAFHALQVAHLRHLLLTASATAASTSTNEPFRSPSRPAATARGRAVPSSACRCSWHRRTRRPG